MKGIKTIAAKLANVTNQPHYIESILRLVFNAGYKKALPQSFAIPIVFLIKQEAWCSITIACTNLTSDGAPIDWAIKKNAHFSMSKLDGIFYFDPISDERTPDWYEEFRFKTAIEAEKAYLKFHN